MPPSEPSFAVPSPRLMPSPPSLLRTRRAGTSAPGHADGHGRRAGLGRAAAMTAVALALATVAAFAVSDARGQSSVQSSARSANPSQALSQDDGPTRTPAPAAAAGLVQIPGACLAPLAQAQDSALEREAKALGYLMCLEDESRTTRLIDDRLHRGASAPARIGPDAAPRWDPLERDRGLGYARERERERR